MKPIAEEEVPRVGSPAEGGEGLSDDEPVKLPSISENPIPDVTTRVKLPTKRVELEGVEDVFESAKGTDLESCYSSMKPTVDSIYQCLGDLIFGEDGATLEQVVMHRLRDRRETVAVADAVTAGLIGQWLSEADPDNADRYGKNVVKIHKRIDHLFADVSRQLANMETKHYLVFHDAFQYFEKTFGLENIGVVALNAHRSPGARHLHELLERIKERTSGSDHSSDSLCVFREPQFSSNALQVLVNEPGVKPGILDPLGADIPLNGDHWFTLMKNLAHGFTECFKS